MMKQWKRLETEELLKNRWISVRKSQYSLGDGTVLDDYYTIERSDYVVIVAEHEHRLLFLEQYRPGVAKTVLNLPMGIIEPGESPAETARRELREETGFLGDSFEPIGVLDLAPSFMSTRAHVIYATHLQRVPGQISDKFEGRTRVFRCPVSKVLEMIYDGRLTDLSSCAAILLAVNGKNR